MKIIHMCLANFFIDDYGYQENMLSTQNQKDGNDTLVIASTETYINNKEIGYVQPEEYTNRYDVRVMRVPYKRYLPHKLMRKIRSYPNIYKILEQEKPDVILFHGVQSWELLTVARYKKNNPNVKLYADNHADRGNSAKGFVSRNFLHKLYYRFIVQKSVPYIDKLFYVTYDRKKFLMDFYKLGEEKLEFYPLGGTVIEGRDRDYFRDKKRKELGLTEKDIVLIHAGKMNKDKKTIELINNFSKVKKQNLKLLIAGSFTDDIKREVSSLIEKDTRITYLGWKPSDELIEYFCSSDLYVQPGSHTVLMEQATCCSLPVVVFDLESYRFLLKDSKHVWIIKDTNELKEIFEEISRNPLVLKEKSQHAYSFAKETLDYRKLAKRLTKNS